MENLKQKFSFFLLNCFFFINSAAFDLTILHDNDVHSRLTEFDYSGSRCGGKNCFGGAARRSFVVKKIRKEEPNTLYLSAGDQFQVRIFQFQSIQINLNQFQVQFFRITIGIFKKLQFRNS